MGSGIKMDTSKIYHGGGKAKTRFSSLGESGGLDEKVKTSVADTTQNYLSSKLTAGVGISTVLLNPGGNEQFQVNNTYGKPLHLLAFHINESPDVGTVFTPTYFLGQNATLKSIWVLLILFQTSDAVSVVTFDVRHITADGTEAVPVTAASGTLLKQITIDNIPNTSGANRYYIGKLLVTSDDASAGEMIFCSVSANTIDLAAGIVMLTYWDLQ